MKQKYHFKIYLYCPKEQIFDGEMTFQEAHRFCDEHATFERRVNYEVFNEAMHRWENYKDTYHGGRKVYDKHGDLYLLEPDYRGMCEPKSQRFHLWCITPDGDRRFIQSCATEEQANKRRIFLQTGRDEYRYVVVPSDIELKNIQ